jgi:thioredoxin
MKKTGLRALFILSCILAITSCQNSRSSVDAQAFNDLLQQRPEAIILDVRTPQEFSMNHMENAQNLNIYDSQFEEMISSLDKNKAIFVYCTSGGRGLDAAKILSKNGFNEVYNLDGGLLKWELEGFPLVKNTVVRPGEEHYSLDDFNEIISSNQLVLFDFMAEWCGPCKAMAPGLHKIEEEFSENLKVVQINVDFNPELSRHFQVSGIPALKIYHKGELVENVVGGRSEEQLREMLSPYVGT